MKRLQLVISDEVYQSLKAEAVRAQVSVADVVRLSIDLFLAKSPQAVITHHNLGEPKILSQEWRERANER